MSSTEDFEKELNMSENIISLAFLENVHLDFLFSCK